MISVSQDTNAHLFYEVDWTDWLASRGYTADQIGGVNFSAHPATGATISHSRLVGAKATVWVKDVLANQKVRITARIVMPAPAAGVDPVTDDYSFQILGQAR
jgi:hypothetical protein